MRRIDITDHRYGRLTVLGPAGKEWICKCDCGEIIIRPAGPLRSGNTKSCGCLQKENVVANARARESNPINIGDRFGELIVIDKSDVRTHQKVHWLCQCSCGKTKAVSAGRLKSGDSKSCGHLSEGDLTGQIFGRLTVKERAGKVRQGEHTRWVCKCSCGNETEAVTDLLKTGKIVSCGCYRREVAGQNFRDEGFEAYKLDPEYAERSSFIYIVEVASIVDKIGIAFDVNRRGYKGEYTKTWWTRKMKRAETWAVEQVALCLTEDWAPEVPYKGVDEWSSTGATEQRTGWVLAEVIEMLEKLCDECEEMGYHAFYRQYMSGYV